MGEHPAADEEERLDCSSTQDGEKGTDQTSRSWRTFRSHRTCGGSRSRNIPLSPCNDISRAIESCRYPRHRRTISQLASCRRWANPRLVKLLTGTPPPSKEHLHASLALLPVDAGQIDYLYQRMLNVDGVELSVIIDFLKPYKEQLVPKLWIILDSTEPGTISASAVQSPPSPSPSTVGNPPAAATPVPDMKNTGAGLDDLLLEKIPMPARSSLILRIAAILAHYDPASQRWEKARDKICNELVRLDPVELAYWVNALRPIKEALIDPLDTMSTDDKRPPTERNIAAVVLRDYGIEPTRPKPGIMLGD